jgi:FMN phosphatase YigB (HAD superfamily)
MKQVLCTDLGQVLIKIDTNPLRSKIKKHMQKSFWGLIAQLDCDQMDLTDFFQKMNRYYCKKPMRWNEFIGYLTRKRSLHQPMLDELNLLKNRGVKVIAITDVNQFHFHFISIKFPELFALFETNIITSYHERSLKRNKTPFTRACSRFGFTPDESVYVDDRSEVIAVAEKLGFTCFLYKINSRRNHQQFKKFIQKHFPAPL